MASLPMAVRVKVSSLSTGVDFKGGYHFSGKPEEIFEKFFGSSNPFEQICGKRDGVVELIR